MKVIDTLNILAVGRNAAIMAVVERLINSHEQWNGLAVTNDTDAVNAFRSKPYDIVLLCAGITPEADTALRTQLQAIAPDVIIAQHYGGGSGLLENEVRGLLAANNISFNF